MVWCKRHRAAFPPGHDCAPRKPHRPDSDEPRDQWGRTATDRKREYARRKASGYYQSEAYRAKQRRRVRPSKAKYPPSYCILCGKKIRTGPGQAKDKKARFCMEHRKPWYTMFRYWTVEREKDYGHPALTPEEAEQLIIARYQAGLPLDMAKILKTQGDLSLYEIPFKIEGHKIKKPFVVWAKSWGQAYAIAARRIPHWIEKRGWVVGSLTKELLQ